MELRTLPVLFLLVGTNTAGFVAKASQVNALTCSEKNLVVLPSPAEKFTSDFNYQSVIISTVSVKQLENHSVKLAWTSTSEPNGISFSVQHSQNGVHWTEIGLLPGKGDYENTYEFIHDDTPAGDNYYRIVFTDFGGSVCCSKTCYAKILTLIDLGIVQTLCNSQITVPCAAETLKDVQLRGLFGRELSARLSVNVKGAVTAHIDELAEGIYFLQCGEVTYRFIKLQ